MKTQREVFNKLFKEEKVELSTEKIELGIVQDLESKLKKMIPDFRELEKVSEKRQDVGIEFSKLKDLEKKISNKLKGDARELNRDLDKAKDKAKELGVDIDTSFIEKNLSQLNSAIKSQTAF